MFFSSPNVAIVPFTRQFLCNTPSQSKILKQIPVAGEKRGKKWGDTISFCLAFDACARMQWLESLKRSTSQFARILKSSKFSKFVFCNQC